MLAVEQVAGSRVGEGWLVRWRIRNAGPDAATIHAAWLPHGRFRSQEWRLDPPLVVPAGGEGLLDSSVAWNEQPGTVVENGFLILRLDGGLRVFARLRITSGADWAPAAVCESVTVSPAGGSG
jgi:hypothetical protein